MATDLNFIIVYFLDLNLKIPTIWNISVPVGTSLYDLYSAIIMRRWAGAVNNIFLIISS